MRIIAIATGAAALALALPAAAQDEAATPPSPGEIVAAAPAAEWLAIAPEDLLVMTLAPAADGAERQVVIQLMPAPFSQGWVENIRTLARAEWYDGISVNRVQDNYVVQWGDPYAENAAKAKPLPDGLRVMEETYITKTKTSDLYQMGRLLADGARFNGQSRDRPLPPQRSRTSDPYSRNHAFFDGFPLSFSTAGSFGTELHETSYASPVHCYGMIGVGRGMSPDTGSGAELYTVIGHAPRHLDRNIALVGRVIEGIEHLSSLPRGSGDLGFYSADEADERTPITSIRVAADLPAAERPIFEYLSTEGASFARYAEARANRRDPFFIVPAGGADICNIPVPVRRAEPR